ncbi:MAG TPA: cytochrome D1 domain-containing protein [Candidatus Limnocylindria bacterium]|nr:cytochrome D1 domain-containing protein [Candidatus Limnocylindria bacterium]
MIAACASTTAEVATQGAQREPESAASTASLAPAPAPAASPSPLYSKLRVFVTSESTDQVWVLDGKPGEPYALAGKIGVGRLPHQLGVSPDGKWVAVNNRMSNTTSVIDPLSMKEVVRLMVGKQPHGIAWSPDSKTVFVGHERDMYIARFEAGTWKALPPLMVGVPQHVLAIAPSRPNELWFTLTNTPQSDVLRIYDLDTKKITLIKISDVHDAFFSPDETEVWSSSSGFVDKPSDRMVIYDPVAKTVKKEIRFEGRYPFHTEKVGQDGVYFMADKSLMVLSDHLGPSLLWVDWKERRVVGETKLGKQPFHTTYDPEGDRLLTTTNVDGMVNVIDVKTRAVVQKLAVPKAHGIGAVGIAGP